jgi:hypothetical protein
MIGSCSYPDAGRDGQLMAAAPTLLSDSDDQARAIEVSIVMPCLDERETIVGCVEEAKAAIVAAGVRGEVVVADNGSTDGSQLLAERAGARGVLVKGEGYGSALMGGIASASGKYVLMGDADGSYDFGELPRFLAKLRAGADLVMGCRLPSGGGTILPGAMPWKHRWLGNPILSSIGRLFFDAPVRDFHCGLRAFRRDAILGLSLRCTGMEFASEMVVKSTLARLRIDQVPITLRPDRRNRPPHLRSWRDGWRHLRFMLLFTPRWLFMVPGSLLTAVGALGFVVLLRGPVTVAGVTFDTNTLLVCSAAIITGAQTIFFGVFTKLFAVHQGLLPPNEKASKLLRSQPVELGIGLGFLALLVGVGYLFGAFVVWAEVDFGQLSYPQSLRIVIPAVTAIALGVQAIFSGFALAILELSHEVGRGPAQQSPCAVIPHDTLLEAADHPLGSRGDASSCD